MDRESFLYENLLNAANYLCKDILKETTCEKITILIFSNKTSTSYISVLASLLLGATFVPVNPEHPVDKILAIIEQVDATVIICDYAHYEKLVEISKKSKICNKILLTDPAYFKRAMVQKIV